MSCAPLNVKRERGRVKKSNVGSVSHRDAEVAELRADRELTVEYARLAVEALNDPADRSVGLIVLRTIAEAYGGLSAVAKDSGISRESLRRSLSPRGNPTLKTLQTVLKKVGLKISVKAA